MLKRVIYQTKGRPAVDGAGVHMVRVFGNAETDVYDPFLMLDAFDSTEPEDYIKGFPMHPHRGIETVTFFSKGGIAHRDHLGTEASVHDGEAQWLTAGSGAFHEEMPIASERVLGTQLWLNMPAKDKMKAEPFYHGITRDEIKSFAVEGGTLRLIAGEYGGESGHRGKYLPLDFYDILLDAHASLTLTVSPERSVLLFTLDGAAEISGTAVDAKTAVKLGEGDEVTIKAGDAPLELLFMSSLRLDEPVAWYGPIVMNTEEELVRAVEELNEGTFLKQEIGQAD